MHDIAFFVNPSEIMPWRMQVFYQGEGLNVTKLPENCASLQLGQVDTDAITRERGDTFRTNAALMLFRIAHSWLTLDVTPPSQPINYASR